jgi:hypothetical protein
MRRNRSKRQSLTQQRKTATLIDNRRPSHRKLTFRALQKLPPICFAYPARTLPKAAICSTSAMAISCHTVRDGIHFSLTALRST